MVDTSKICPAGRILVSGGPFKGEEAPFCIDEHEVTQAEYAAEETSRVIAEFQLIAKSRSKGATSIVARGNVEGTIRQIAIAYLREDRDVSGVEIKTVPFFDRPKIEGKLEGPRKPMVYVCWYEARAYCQAKGGDLPTRDQWKRQQEVHKEKNM